MPEPTAGGHIINCFRKYAVFAGRARRKEYWYYTLFLIFITITLTMADLSFGLIDPEFGVGLLTGTFMLATLLPSISVSVRRLHDTGRSAWWLLLGFFPLLNVLLIVFMALDSNPGMNAYGNNPKDANSG